MDYTNDITREDAITPIKLGLIGCGIAARELHLPVLKRLTEQFEVVCVCNHTEDKARHFSELVGNVPYELDYQKVLARKDVEAVAITLPIHLNSIVAQSAFRAGKHILMEKPIAANLQEAKELLDMSAQAPTVSMIAENLRYKPMVRRLKERIKAGIIGKPYFVKWDSFYFMSLSNPYAQTEWRIHHQYPGGFLTDGGVHNIAVLRMLFGELRKSNSIVRQIRPEIGEMDTLSYQFYTESGPPGVLNLFYSSSGFHENRLHVFGLGGSLMVEKGEVRLIKEGEHTQVIDQEESQGYYEEWLDFYQAIRHHKPVDSPFLEGFLDFSGILQAIQV